jgi:hypothetical protein
MIKLRHGSANLQGRSRTEFSHVNLSKGFRLAFDVLRRKVPQGKY